VTTSRTIDGIRVLSFNRNLVIGENVRLRDQVPFDGWLQLVTIHWPGGCNALVDVTVIYGSQQFLPDAGFLALDDVTKDYWYGKQKWVLQNQPIIVHMRNRDALFTHNITVTVTFQQPEKGE
jgi:hypothetical protein